MLPIDQKLSIPEIAEQFGIIHASNKEADGAYLSKVYIINDKYIIRGRPYSPSTIHNFGREIKLIEEVRRLIEYQLPSLIPASNTELYCVNGNVFYTVYPLLAGKNICTWYDLEKASDDQTAVILAAQRDIHTQTIGHFPKETSPPQSFVQITSRKFKHIEDKLMDVSRERISKALQVVQNHTQGCTSGDLCFVHGDFHHGNVLFDGQSTVSGIIDLDRSRIGHYLEDFAFTFMVLQRIYASNEYIFDEKKLRKLLQWYKFSPEDMDLLIEYWILYIFSDYYVMVTEDPLPNSELYMEYQKSYLDTICKKF